jgi:aerotolerance regulator-like protein/VWA domain-containing protein
MSFANPILLLGLFGAAVPIILHLIHKRRPRKHPFAAIELVLRSVERVERKWRLKRFLLLLSRVSLLAALSLAAAGPLVGGEKALAVVSSGPKRLGIVVDCSLSMRARYGQTSAFIRAVAQARSLVDAMGSEDQAVIVAARAKPELLVPRPTAARDELLSVLDRLTPSFGGADLGEAVTTAAQALGTLKDGSSAEDPAHGAKPKPAHIVVLSDLAGHAFQSAADLSLPGGGTAEIEVVDVLQGIAGEKRTNRAVTSLDALNVPGHAPRTVEFRARIQSFVPENAGKNQAADITLVGPQGNLERGSVEVTPGTIVDKVMQHAFEEPGVVPVDVKLEPDVLAEDDVRFAIADVRRQVRTLIVDGAPSGVPKEDEVFYLERALQVGAIDQPSPRVITADDLAHADLAGYDVVVLAGVNSFGRSDGARLIEFVEKGGGLLITASQDMDLELYNAELARILPRQLRTVKMLDPETGGLGADGLVTLRSPALDHPVLEIFDGQALGGLLSTKTRAYVLLQPGTTAAKQTRVLVEYEDGQPAIVEGEAGSGRVILLTTSIDRDLTDLPIRPAFVPLVRRMILELGNALSKPDPRKTLVGEARRIRVPQGATRLSVRGPDGKERVWEQSELGLEGEVQLAETHLPGHYAVKAAFAGPLLPIDGESFAVNVDTKESDLRPISIDEATAILLGNAPGAHSADAAVAIARAQALRGLANPEVAAGALLILMLIAFLAESVLTAQKIGR